MHLSSKGFSVHEYKSTSSRLTTLYTSGSSPASCKDLYVALTLNMSRTDIEATLHIISTNVIKLGPDRLVQSVQLGIGLMTGPVSLLDRMCNGTGHDVIKPV